MKKLHLKNITIALFSTALSILFIIGVFIIPDELVVHKLTLQLNHWEKKHDNLKVAVISDIHAGSPFIGVKKLEKIVELINKEKPDLILLPGDFLAQGVIGCQFIKPEITAHILSGLRYKYPITAVLGNHDIRYNRKRVVAALEKEKITVLYNSSEKIMINGKPVWIAGIDDLTRGYPDIEKALSKIPDKSPILLLSHNPDAFPFVPKRVSLTVSGHTHGGQVKFPVVGSLVVPSIHKQRYAYGHVHENNKDLFVSSGIGTSILPIRFGVRPEIVILTLKSKQNLN